MTKALVQSVNSYKFISYNTPTFIILIDVMLINIAALVHDLAECIVGDLTPHCGVSPEEKHRREDEAMKIIAELTGLAGDTMYELYKVNMQSCVFL